MRILMALLLAAVPTVALADAPKDVKQMKTDDCARARKQNKTCVIDIEGMDVEGVTATNNGSHITIPDFGKANSLIRIRRDFIAEILKSAEDI